MEETIIIFSENKFTVQQEEELKYQFNIYRFEYLPLQYFKLWSNINPLGELDSKIFKVFKDFLSKRKNEGVKYVYFEGDKGAEFYMVRCALAINMIPLYSSGYCTIQEREEDACKEKSHICFGKYIDYQGGVE